MYNMIMEKKELKRKIYTKLLDWKNNSQGKTCLLIEGARRVGKSTICEIFGQKEYKSYIIIDFVKASKAIKDNFDNLNNLDVFYQIISVEYNKKLYLRKSLIVFDEIQNFPRAREALKYLVLDGRYDFIETGSLISIKENVKNITIPSEEEKIRMYPLDFEEFLLAAREDPLIDLIKNSYSNKKALPDRLHQKAMRLFYEYMLVGGMPKSVVEYFANNRDFKMADKEKRKILSLYQDDIKKASKLYNSKISYLFENIPAFLSTHEKKVTLNRNNDIYSTYEDAFFWLEDSSICNLCYKSNDPSVGLALNKNLSAIKCYLNDTGLLFSLTFNENELMDNKLYQAILNGRLTFNKGMLFENVIAQMLVAKGHKLYFYTHYNLEKHRNDIEIDFLISNQSYSNYKICPIEVKSSKNYTLTSYQRFKERYPNKIASSIVIHPKQFSVGELEEKIPPYMLIAIFND